MDFSHAPADDGFRHEVRAWLAANRPARAERIPHDEASLAEEFGFLRDWQRRLHAAGYVGLLWPREYGGRGARPTAQAILNEELARARAPQLLNRVGINNTGPTLIAHGTEAQKRRYLPKILSADEIWCQLFSEPGAGSDLAALRTRAQAEGDGFVVTGQKVWTSYAELSGWAILLARTDPSLPKHRGITYFLLDMRSRGITIRPLRQATGSTEFSEVFLDGVRVPGEQVVGAVNRGWEIAMTTLAHERGTGFAFKEQVLQRIALEDAVALARSIGRARDPAVRQEIARRWIDVEIMRLMNCRTLTRLERGEEPGPESSLVKLFWAELTQRLHELGLALEGPRGQLAEGRWQQTWLWSRVASIAGGTSEVQANIIAQRLLGLPR
ncbi:MAG: acyl-CoA dehydrogenase [Deltaproteobacteria bacterium]|nr:MAG: acyl-CoA dehydrogenase [Deltaproteobacteria bacterium]